MGRKRVIVVLNKIKKMNKILLIMIWKIKIIQIIKVLILIKIMIKNSRLHLLINPVPQKHKNHNQNCKNNHHFSRNKITALFIKNHYKSSVCSVPNRFVHHVQSSVSIKVINLNLSNRFSNKQTNISWISSRSMMIFNN